MEQFWAFIEKEEEFELHEKAVQLFGDLYFSPKMQLNELDIANIQMKELKFLFTEISQIPSDFDEEIQSNLSNARLNVFHEAEARKLAAKIAWAIGKIKGAKKFF